MANRRKVLKNILGELPLTAEIYWQLFQRGKPVTRSFSLRRIHQYLPEWCDQVRLALSEDLTPKAPGKRVLLFTTLRYWIEHGTLLGAALAGLGHQVTFAYLPFPNFYRHLSSFDIRRHNAYARRVLKAASEFMTPLSLMDVPGVPLDSLPDVLEKAVREVSLRDTQYSLQIEEV